MQKLKAPSSWDFNKFFSSVEEFCFGPTSFLGTVVEEVIKAKVVHKSQSFLLFVKFTVTCVHN